MALGFTIGVDNHIYKFNQKTHNLFITSDKTLKIFFGKLILLVEFYVAVFDETFYGGGCIDFCAHLEQQCV